MHLDVRSGDRLSMCGGLMRPVALGYRSGKGWLIVHACERCGHTARTRAALDDPYQPDDVVNLARLSGRSMPS
jgi:hypothetical protein